MTRVIKSERALRGAYWVKRKGYRVRCGHQKEKHHLEVIGVVERITLILILLTMGESSLGSSGSGYG
jgi:hypothetical protein